MQMGRWLYFEAACYAILACQVAIATEARTFASPSMPAQVQQTILQAVRMIEPHRIEHRRYRIALPFGAPLFPSDVHLAATRVTPALAAWLALPAIRRQHDVMIAPDIDYYWLAEGRQYSCQFIIHIEKQVTGSRLMVLQVQPT